MTQEKITFTYMDSFVGKILVAEDSRGLRAIHFMEGTNPHPPDSDWHYVEDSDTDAMQQLHAYFKGDLHKFDLPLFQTGTSFEQEVWNALQQIPYGETVSYGDVARQVGRPKAVRAVGGANGKNSIPIVVPCHRVLGSNGRLTGFGSGLPIKVALLEHERKYSPRPVQKNWRF